MFGKCLLNILLPQIFIKALLSVTSLKLQLNINLILQVINLISESWIQQFQQQT
jgi:hypothetical protein